MQYVYHCTYIYFLSVSFSLVDPHFYGIVGVNLEDGLFCLLVDDLNMASLACLGHLQSDFNLSLSFLVFNIALFKFESLV